jgi:hypothetical protein
MFSGGKDNKKENNGKTSDFLSNSISEQAFFATFTPFFSPI